MIDEYKNAFQRKNLAENKQKADLKGRLILLAEDVEINADIIKMILSIPITIIIDQRAAACATAPFSIFSL